MEVNTEKRRVLPTCPQECRYFDRCSAPLCPLDEGSMAGGTYFPNEEVCQLKAFCHEPWIRNQKKIAKKSRKIEYYFTLRMLQHNCIIGKGIEGLDPDHDASARERDEDRWLKEHPRKRIISEAEREKFKRQMIKVRQGLIPTEKYPVSLEKTNFNMPSINEIMT